MCIIGKNSTKLIIPSMQLAPLDLSNPSIHSVKEWTLLSRFVSRFFLQNSLELTLLHLPQSTWNRAMALLQVFYHAVYIVKCSCVYSIYTSLAISYKEAISMSLLANQAFEKNIFTNPKQLVNIVLNLYD